MSAVSPSPSAAVRIKIVDLTEGMSDADFEQAGPEDGGEVNEARQTPDKKKKKKRRSNRRAGRNKAKKSNTNEDAASETGTVATEPLTDPFVPRPAQDAAPGPAAIYDQLVPVLPLYRIGDAPSPGPCVQQRGLFATEMIAPGTRIIQEVPLLTLPAPYNQIDGLMAAFDALSTDEQEEIWKLAPAETDASKDLMDMGYRLAETIGSLMQILTLPRAERTLEESNRVAEELPWLAEYTQSFRLLARWHFARYSVTDVDKNDFSALFLKTANTRHSCVPNCHAEYDSGTNCMTLHTTRPVLEGEELTVSYMTAPYYFNARARAEQLYHCFDIQCACEACNPSHFKFAQHEQCRTAISHWAMQISHFCTLVPAIDLSPATVQTDLCLSADMPLPMDGSHAIDLGAMESVILRLMQSLSDTGCHGPDIARYYAVLLDRISPRAASALPTDALRLRCYNLMLCRAHKAEAMLTTCFGSDSHHVASAAHRRSQIEALLRRAHARIAQLELSRRKLGAGHARQEWEIVAMTSESGRYELVSE
ncbi:hypothetical protein ACEQ8H_007231 [Pleosporales sp. CAS-2024a]